MSSFLFDHEDKLVSVEAILTTWRKRLAQRAAAQVEASPSDLPIPALGTLLDATEERAETARRQGDFEAAELLGEVWLNVLNGARLAWRRGDLVIYLSDTLTCPVSRDGCRWPGCASRAACWHAVLYDLLLDLQEDAAVTADARVWKEAA